MVLDTQHVFSLKIPHPPKKRKPPYGGFLITYMFYFRISPLQDQILPQYV